MRQTIHETNNLMKRTASLHRIRCPRTALIALALVSFIAAVFVAPSSAQVTNTEPLATKNTTWDVIEFLAQHGVALPAVVAQQYTSLTEQEQHQRLIALGIDRFVLSADIEERPMPLVAELLRVLDPDAPRPEIASDDDYARSMLDASASAVINDLQGQYASRLGFARWDQTANGGRVLVIPIVDPTQREITLIEGKSLLDETAIRVEKTDISYQDLRELKNSLDVSIRSATENRLANWSIGIERATQSVFVHVDLSLERNRELLSGIDGVMAFVNEEQTSNNQGNPQIKDLLIGDGETHHTVDEELSGDKESGDLLAGLANVVRNAANSFVMAELPLSSRTGTEMVSIVDVKMAPPDTDYRESSHIRGGEWVVSDAGGSCTTNFLWKRGGSYRMGTGGHCSTNTGTSSGNRAYRTFEHRTLSGTRNGAIGKVTHNGWTNDSNSDYALMTLPSAATRTNRVMTTSGNWRTVTAVSALSNLTSGLFPVCHVGLGLKKTHGLDKSCGKIFKHDVHKTIELSTGSTLTLYGLYCTDAKRAGGDSGGPHYFEVGDDAYAVGIHQGTHQGDNACFTTVQAAKERSGYSIVLN